MSALNIYKNKNNPNNEWVKCFINPMTAYPGPESYAPPVNVLVAFILNTDLLKTVRYGWTVSLMGVTTDMPVQVAVVEPCNDKAGNRLHFAAMLDSWQVLNSYKAVPISVTEKWQALQIANQLKHLGLWP